MAVTRRSVLSGALAFGAAGVATGCMRGSASPIPLPDTGVSFESFSAGFDAVVDTAAQPRLLSDGHWWAEGPAWDRQRQRLYFTDVPRNRAYVWSQSEGAGLFLSPSGVEAEKAQGMREPGANGLMLSHSGELLICNHGERAVEARNFTTGARRTLASAFNGKLFNSPNDLVEARDGAIYFTDPPYGLSGLNDSPLKQLAHNGVYRLAPDGSVSLLVEDMTFPNGVVLSPDETSLYVSQSDPKAPLIRRFSLSGDDRSMIGEGEIWFDAQPFMHDVGGLPDGMAVSVDGHIMLAGPNGVLVIDRDGACLGRIATGRASANCAFGEDGRTLFITAKDRLLAVRTKIAGLGQF